MLNKVKTALLSVSDKSGIVEFATELHKLGIQLICTEGTATTLQQNEIPFISVSECTGFPEILDGRVKTLHPHIYGGILAKRNLEAHLSELEKHKIKTIDLVVVNLYQFVKHTEESTLSIDGLIEQIDIGGLSIIRAAAKNFQYVSVVTAPNEYQKLLKELQANSGVISLETRFKLVQKAFNYVANYDSYIADFFTNRMLLEPQNTSLTIIPKQVFPTQISIKLEKQQDLRYGENPHQEAALYIPNNIKSTEIADIKQIQGKELSFNNIVDINAGWHLVNAFKNTACAIIKHNNPCGVSEALILIEALKQALITDPESAFGGIFAFNKKVDKETAEEITKYFVEVVVAPEFDEESINIFAKKKNLRVIQANVSLNPPEYDVRVVAGGVLLQTLDSLTLNSNEISIPTKRYPTDAEMRSLIFAWTVCKHVRSNAIVYARNGQTVGIGAGQMSRIDSVKIGIMKARLPIQGCVMASDAFFPFRDAIDEVAKNGITAVIQPGGSIRDQEVIDAANEHDLAMVFTGIRHFKH